MPKTALLRRSRRAALGLLLLAGALAPAAASAQATAAPVRVPPADSVPGISMGRADAPVVIYEFADYQCTGCGQFTAGVGTQMKNRLVETGQVRFVYFDFPLVQHRQAFRASRAARCANDQGKFWEYHTALYARQREMRTPDATPFFAALADSVGLERSAFDGCLASDRHAEAVARSLQYAGTLDVRGTPTLYINGRKLSPAAYQTIESLEQTVREEASAGGACCTLQEGSTGTTP